MVVAHRCPQIVEARPIKAAPLHTRGQLLKNNEMWLDPPRRGGMSPCVTGRPATWGLWWVAKELWGFVIRRSRWCVRINQATPAINVEVGG